MFDGIGVFVGIGTGVFVGIGMGVFVGVGITGVLVGVGNVGVSVGVGRIGVSVGVIIMTGVLVRRTATAPVRLCMLLCAYAFGDKKNTTPTNTKSIRMQKSARTLCNATCRCPALFCARTCTYFLGPWGWSFVLLKRVQLPILSSHT